MAWTKTVICKEPCEFLGRCCSAPIGQACTMTQARESGESERAKHDCFRLNNPEGELAAYVLW